MKILKPAFVLIISMILYANTALAQNQNPVEIVWQKCFGVGGGDYGKKIIKTADGGFLLAGETTGGVSIDSCSGYGEKALLVKMDSVYNVTWQKCVVGSYSFIEVNDVQQTADGGYILIGTANAGVISENQVYIIKTDDLGNFEWQKVLGGYDDDFGSSIRQLADGNYILCGYVYSNNVNVSGNHGMADYWLVKIDSIGTLLWQKCFGGTQEDIARSIIVTTNNDYLITGTSDSYNGDITSIPHGYDEMWVIKTDSSGTLLWENTLGGNGDDEGYTLIATPDGGCISVGASNTPNNNDVSGNLNSFDFWMVKLDGAGNLMWQNCLGAYNADRAMAISPTTDGGYILAGYVIEIGGGSPSGPFLTNYHGYEDYLVIKTDSIGNSEWAHCFGGSARDRAFSIVETSQSNYLVLGNSESNDGDLNRPTFYNRDFWVVKFTDESNLITGNCFADLNSDGIRDSNELGIPFQKINETTTGEFEFTGSDGNYEFHVIDTGSFYVTGDPLNYYNMSPAGHPAVFTSMLQEDSLNNFAYAPAASINDLCITITPLVNFRSGMQATYMINYRNEGTTALMPTVIFIRDQNLTVISAVPIPTITGTDSLFWSPGVLQPFESESIVVTVLVSTGLPIGTLINSYAIIEPIPGDAYPACNTAFYEVLTTGSFDPNDILVSRKTLLTTEFPNPPFLDYVIRFQNTGNDTAFTVKLLNNIQPELKIETFDIVDASHEMSVDYNPISRLMTFQYDNILLPHLSNNEPASHGFVRYRIQPVDTLVAGDQLLNEAFIYFDYNLPIGTGTVTTTVILPTATGEIKNETTLLQIYPNPANGFIQIKSSLNPGNYTVQITDITGRIISQHSHTTSTNTFDTRIETGDFSKGVYLVEVVAGNVKLQRGKFVKN